jgi:hypothetical protein
MVEKTAAGVAGRLCLATAKIPCGRNACNELGNPKKAKMGRKASHQATGRDSAPICKLDELFYIMSIGGKGLQPKIEFTH